MKTIKLKNVQPGMAVKGDTFYGLVVAVDHEKITFYDGHDPYWGKMCSLRSKRTDEIKVKVLPDPRRKELVMYCLREAKKRRENCDKTIQELELINSLLFEKMIDKDLD